MATKTVEELKQMAIQIRDEKANKQNTATRIGTQMLEHLNKLEQEYYDKTNIDEQKKQTDVKFSELDQSIQVLFSEIKYLLVKNKGYILPSGDISTAITDNYKCSNYIKISSLKGYYVRLTGNGTGRIMALYNSNKTNIFVYDSVTTTTTIDIDDIIDKYPEAVYVVLADCDSGKYASLINKKAFEESEKINELSSKFVIFSGNVNKSMTFKININISKKIKVFINRNNALTNNYFNFSFYKDDSKISDFSTGSYDKNALKTNEFDLDIPDSANTLKLNTTYSEEFEISLYYILTNIYDVPSIKYLYNGLFFKGINPPIFKTIKGLGTDGHEKTINSNFAIISDFIDADYFEDILVITKHFSDSDLILSAYNSDKELILENSISAFKKGANDIIAFIWKKKQNTKYIRLAFDLNFITVIPLNNSVIEESYPNNIAYTSLLGSGYNPDYKSFFYPYKNNGIVIKGGYNTICIFTYSSIGERKQFEYDGQKYITKTNLVIDDAELKTQVGNDISVIQISCKSDNIQEVPLSVYLSFCNNEIFKMLYGKARYLNLSSSYYAILDDLNKAERINNMSLLDDIQFDSSAKTIEIASQEDFNTLFSGSDEIKNDLLKGYDVFVHFSKGVYRYSQTIFTEIENLNAKLCLSGDKGCIFIPQGNTYKKQNAVLRTPTHWAVDYTLSDIHNTFVTENSLMLFSELNDRLSEDLIFQSTGMIETVEGNKFKIKLPVGLSERLNIINEKTLTDTYVFFDRSYLGTLVKAYKIDTEYIYIDLDAFSTPSDAAGSINLTYNFSEGKEFVRFRIINYPNDFQSGKLLFQDRKLFIPNEVDTLYEISMKNSFLRAVNVNLKLLAITGLTFVGNYYRGLQTIYIEDCSNVFIGMNNFIGASGIILGKYENALMNKSNALIYKNTFKDFLEGSCVSSYQNNTEICFNTVDTVGIYGIGNSSALLNISNRFSVHDNIISNYHYSSIGTGFSYGKTDDKFLHNEGIIENNLILQTDKFINTHKYCRSDAGAMYVGTVNKRVIIRNNFIYGYRSNHKGTGIYCDDGSFNVKIYANIVLGIKNYYTIYCRYAKVSTYESEQSTGNLIINNILDGAYYFAGNTIVSDNNNYCSKNLFINQGSYYNYTLNVVKDIANRESDINNDKLIYNNGCITISAEIPVYFKGITRSILSDIL